MSAYFAGTVKWVIQGDKDKARRELTGLALRLLHVARNAKDVGNLVHYDTGWYNYPAGNIRVLSQRGVDTVFMEAVSVKALPKELPQLLVGTGGENPWWNAPDHEMCYAYLYDSQNNMKRHTLFDGREHGLALDGELGSRFDMNGNGLVVYQTYCWTPDSMPVIILFVSPNYGGRWETYYMKDHFPFCATYLLYNDVRVDQFNNIFSGVHCYEGDITILKSSDYGKTWKSVVNTKCPTPDITDLSDDFQFAVWSDDKDTHRFTFGVQTNAMWIYNDGVWNKIGDDYPPSPYSRGFTPNPSSKYYGEYPACAKSKDTYVCRCNLWDYNIKYANSYRDNGTIMCNCPFDGKQHWYDNSDPWRWKLVGGTNGCGHEQNWAAWSEEYPVEWREVTASSVILRNGAIVFSHEGYWDRNYFATDHTINTDGAGNWIHASTQMCVQGECGHGHELMCLFSTDNAMTWLQSPTGLYAPPIGWWFQACDIKGDIAVFSHWATHYSWEAGRGILNIQLGTVKAAEGLIEWRKLYRSSSTSDNPNKIATQNFEVTPMRIFLKK